MMHRWSVLVAVGCDADVPMPRSAEPSPAIATVVADAAVDAWDPPGDAVHSIQRRDVRQAVRDAPRWIARSYSSGLVRPDESLTTYTLQREGDQALVTLEQRRRRIRMTESAAAPWQLESEREWPCSVSEQGNTLTFTPLDGVASPPFDTCMRTKLKVAGAAAVRATQGGKRGECGDIGRWLPATMKQVEVLQCDDETAFATAPGVEHVEVNDDCLQGGGWRAIAKDGSVAPVRQ